MNKKTVLGKYIITDVDTPIILYLDKVRHIHYLPAKRILHCGLDVGFYNPV